MISRLFPAGVMLAATSWAIAGPYAPAAGEAGSTAISYDDPSIVEWATSIDLTRGLQDINSPAGPTASFGASTDAIGMAGSVTTDVVSLGDGGTALVSFATPIINGPGADFAVFENGLIDTFLELAFVEVSSDGSNFFRFPSVSLTPTDTQVESFGAIDPTNLNNLAGKYRVGFGTPFDLQELVGIAGLDVNNIQKIKLIDVVGRIDSAPDNPSWIPSRDSLNNIINDLYPTAFPSGGFDLDGVGAINVIPEPSMLAATGLISLSLLRRRSH